MSENENTSTDLLYRCAAPMHDCISGAMYGRVPTTVIVSNRCSAIRHADVILVLDEGQVVDQGIHEDLISRPGMYANVWERQREGEEGLT